MILTFNNETNQPDGYTFDLAGNLRGDGSHCYQYDAENRISTVFMNDCSTVVATYIYDANGYRVHQTGYYSNTCSPNDGIRDFGYDIFGHQTFEHNSGGTSCREEIYAGSRHLASYGGGEAFSHSDWLGTERFRKYFYPDQTNYQQTCTSLPFGDGFSCTVVSNADPSPMHFTGKQHDGESGLDNFGARYNSSQLGRFMSPDPLLSSGRVTNPQTWNRYTYALNNPLRIVDPTGLYDWDESAGGSMSDEDLQAIADDRHNKRRIWAQSAIRFREMFRNALDAADEAAGSSVLSDDQQSAAQAGVDAYGTEGDANGVIVGIQGGYGASTLLNNDDTISVKFGSSAKGDFLTATVGHEGAHVDQAQTWLRGGEGSVGDINHYAREQAAWAVGSSIAQALGMKNYRPHGGGSEYDVWNRGWKAADVETFRSRGIGNILNYMNLKPTDTDTFSYEHHQ